jgi:hypothetical protein
MQNGYVESFNGRMRDELLNESLFFGLDHARSAIAEWVEDFNTARPHSSLGYQTPAAFAGHPRRNRLRRFARYGLRVSTGCSTRALRRNRNGRGSNRRWMKVQWQVKPADNISTINATFPPLRPPKGSSAPARAL